MAISDSEKLDFLWKKVVFGVSKTAAAAAKDGSNETVASPGAVYANQIWAQADATNIPSTPPVSDTAVIERKLGANRIALTMDPTSPANQTWLAGSGDFIPPTFGSGYLVKVYVGDPNGSKAARIFPGTTGEEYVFDYVAGVLNFVGTIPSNKAATIGTGTVSVATDGVYIEVYKYIGLKGGSTSKSSVVNDIAARNALTGMSAGDIVHVKDASGIPTDAKAGEYANYMWNGDEWKLIGTQDSARTDALTTKLTLTHETTSMSLGFVGNGARVVSVSIEVTDAFDGSMAVKVGDSVVDDRMMAADQNDLQTLGSYVTTPIFQYSTSGETELLLTVSGTATVGAANLVITYA